MDSKELSKIVKRLEELKVNNFEEFEKFISQSSVTRQALSATSFPYFPYIEQTFAFIVQKRSLAQAIEAGKYDHVNNDINEDNFPNGGEYACGIKEMAVFHFNRDISSEDAVKEITKAGYRPATLMELLALGEKHPDIKRLCPIIALGAFAAVIGYLGRRRVAGLWHAFWDDVGKRYLGLLDWDVDRSSAFRFLAVRE